MSGSYDEIDLDMERDPDKMSRDELIKAVKSMKRFFDKYGQVDRRFRADDLYSRWTFRSPAGRWETVVAVDHDERPWTRVWTDKTGPDWAWRFLSSTKLEAAGPLGGGQNDPQPEVRIVDLSVGRGGQMVAVVTQRNVQWPSFGDGASLATAYHEGAGKGWKVVDRPGGGAAVETQHSSKATARTALLRAARAHAKALKIPVRTAGT